ncbi:MAG: sensor histidine kinase [Planctomycetales bacterium]
MWRYVLPPVLLIALVWIAMSTITTLYLRWLEQTYSRVFQGYYGSIQAAKDLQQDVRHVRTIWPDEPDAIPVTYPLLLDTLEEISAHRRQLERAAQAASLTEGLQGLSDQLAQLEALVQAEFGSDPAGLESTSRRPSLEDARVQVNDLTSTIHSTMANFMSRNEEVINDINARRDRFRLIVFSLRLSMIVVGPILGVWLGWRLSRRLFKSVSQLAVTLDQGRVPEIDLGTITLQPGGILEDVQSQAEQVVARLHHALRDLEAARGELVRSERLAAVGQLAAGVAHELRNPLTSVKLLLQHAARRQDAPSLTENQLQMTLKEIGRMETTIQGLLDFSRQRPLRRTRFDLGETLRRVVSLIDGRAHQQQVRVLVEGLESEIPLIGEPEQLHQVLVNLLLNALEAMPDGGDLSVIVSHLSAERRVRVKIRDNGPGIPPEILERVFEPFVTSKERGTGLGLAISRRIIDEHGGLLLAANHPDGGAQFTMELETAPPADSELEATQSRASPLVLQST